MTKIIFVWKYMSFSQIPFFYQVGQTKRDWHNLCKSSSVFVKYRKNILGLHEFSFLSVDFWLRQKFIVGLMDICKSCGNQKWCEQGADTTTRAAFCPSTFFRALVAFVAKYVSADLSRGSLIILCSACSWNNISESLDHIHKTCRR